MRRNRNRRTLRDVEPNLRKTLSSSINGAEGLFGRLFGSPDVEELKKREGGSGFIACEERTFFLNESSIRLILKIPS